MPSWFSKVFKADATGVRPAPAEPVKLAERSAALTSTATAAILEPEPHQAPRRVVQAPLLVAQDEPSAGGEEIRIKARVNPDRQTCVFWVDRPVLAGHSAWYPETGAAEPGTLAAALFDLEGVAAALIHDVTLTVTRGLEAPEDWEPLAREIGARIRDHLKSGRPVVPQEFFEAMPSEDEFRERLQHCLDTVINPGIAAHSGAIRLERVVGNTAYITMEGGCQGCAASTITLVQGVHEIFRDAVPELGAILDETDHMAGVNPFYKELPAGMQP